MKKNILLTITLVLAYIFLSPVMTFAAVCGEAVPTDEGALRDYIASCNSKLKDLGGQKATLSQAISYLDTQINLTQAKIAATESDLAKLELEIVDLTGKIDSLDISLDNLTALFIARVRSSYIRQESLVEVSALQLGDGTIPQVVRSLQYVKKVRNRDQELLVALEKSRIDYHTEKTAKEIKQEAVASLKADLDSQQRALSEQKASKAKLLADTQNDEKKYSALLSAASRQLASFRRFVSSQGGATLLGDETRCNDWGCYYNQRDGSWGNQLMGLSDSLMREYGCLVTSMAMIASHYGKSLRPGDIAASSDPFFGSTAYMNLGTWSVNGVSMTRTRLGSSLALIDSELAAGRPVVVGIYGGPDHFLVIKGKSGDDYLMHDPYPSGGADLVFTSKYPLSAISTVDRVTVN